MRERTEARSYANERATYVRSVPILMALEANCETYESGGYRTLSSRLNQWADSPHKARMQERSYNRFAASLAASSNALLNAVRTCAGEHDPLTVILRDEALVLEMNLAVLARHIASLLDNEFANEIGFADQSETWIIVADRNGFATCVFD